MLQRILEPEVMDSVEDACDYDTMDHSQVNQKFVTDLLHLRSKFTSMLDVGTGTAQIPIELCQRQREVRIVAIDMAQNMLRVGQRNVELAKLTQRIQLRLQDAKRMPFADGAFDVVMSNSIVHHIPEPSSVFAEMARVVKADGLLFVRDLLRPVDEATLASLVQTYAGAANAHQQKLFAESLHAALMLDDVRAIVASLGFDPTTVQQTSDRHWTWAAVKPLAA